MKVTYGWLKDFVEISITPEKLADKLTMAGLEVVSLQKSDGDYVFEIEITSNRPDWLSIIGIAREVSAITGRKLSYPPLGLSRGKKTKGPDGITLDIQDKKDCPLYIAKIIRGVKVGPSPDWLRRRLELVGIRSINNVVDITNYILMEWGEPLHAFDLDKISGALIQVRRAKNNEKITTLDAEERVLNPGILVIADKERPAAIAGIMGGKDSEVTAATANILLEAAVFDPVLIRRSRQKLGVQTESAYRFERGINAGVVERASDAAVKLIRELASGECVLAKKSGALKLPAKKVVLDIPAAQKFLNIDITHFQIKRILEGLEFKIKSSNKNKILAVVPTHRQDVSSPIDLIEEIARIYGFASVPKSLPAINPRLTLATTRDLVSGLKNILVGLGLQEVITCSLIDKDLLKNFPALGDNQAIEMLNPLSKEQEILRPTLLPSLAQCIARNLNQKQEYVAIFETSKVFRSLGASVKEELVLGIALCGARPWLFEQGLVRDQVGWLHLKGILGVFLARLGVKEYDLAPLDAHTVSISLKGEEAGVMRQLRRDMLDYLDIKNRDVFAMELSLEKAFAHIKPEHTFAPLPKYPGISRDISFILRDEVSLKDILGVIREKGKPFLSQAQIADYYQGKQIPAGYRGLTVSCLYRSFERTLTETEITPIHGAICAVLAERFGATIRSLARS